MRDSPPPDHGQESVPFFLSWKRAYLAVLILLALLILCFAFLSGILS